MGPVRHGVLRGSRATGSGPAATPMMRAASAPGNLLPATGQRQGKRAGRHGDSEGTANGVELSRPSPLVPGTLRDGQVRSRTANAAAFSQRAASDHAVMVNMRTLPRLAETTSSRAESAI
jgi:hypothetical protein